MRNQVHMTVLGGLPITVEYSIEQPDMSVGIWGGSVDEWSIVAINDRPVKKEPKWLYARIEKAREEDKIIEACGEHYANLPYPYDDEPDE